MKSVILVLLLFVSTSVFSQQVELTSFAEYGWTLPKEGMPTEFQGSINLTPGVSFDSTVRTEIIARSMFFDSSSLFQTGLRVGYCAFRFKSSTLWVNSDWTYDAESKNSIGGGATFENNILKFNVTYLYNLENQNTKSKYRHTFIFGVGYPF